MKHRTYTDRYDQLAEQHAYARRTEVFGLSALLAPYAVQPPQRAAVPSQRGRGTTKRRSSTQV